LFGENTLINCLEVQGKAFRNILEGGNRKTDNLFFKEKQINGKSGQWTAEEL
jgi:hypothetical protein